MEILSRLLAGFVVLALSVPLASPSASAQAQPSASSIAVPRIDGFDVEAVAQPAPGNELAFTLYGSPGGIASVAIGGATGTLLLVEVETGVYEGSYTIGRRDRVTADSTATANLRLGNRVASSVLDESLVAGAPARWQGGVTPAGAGPRIDRFEVDPPQRLAPGEELLFALTGSPGGRASVRIGGVKGKLALEEVTNGVYEGSYTVRNRDRIAANTVVTGNLRLGKQERSMVLGQALIEGSASRLRTNTRRVAAPVPKCASCGVVEAVNLVEHKGEGSYLGMIAGGVAGALLGSQVGKGQGTTVAEIAGAAGGAWAGNEVEKRMKTTRHYEVVVRLENGGSQMFSYPTEPGVRAGTLVRVENGALVPL